MVTITEFFLIKLAFLLPANTQCPDLFNATGQTNSKLNVAAWCVTSLICVNANTMGGWTPLQGRLKVAAAHWIDSILQWLAYRQAIPQFNLMWYIT